MSSADVDFTGELSTIDTFASSVIASYNASFIRVLNWKVDRSRFSAKGVLLYRLSTRAGFIL